MADNRPIVATIGKESYLTKLENGIHSLNADEPLEIGGRDQGPTPGDLLRMSLASCTAITLRMYADRKGFDVSEIKVEVTSEETEGKTVFHRHVSLSGTVDHEQRARMLHIANSCPVHKVLTHTITVNTIVST